MNSRQLRKQLHAQTILERYYEKFLRRYHRDLTKSISLTIDAIQTANFQNQKYVFSSRVRKISSADRDGVEAMNSRQIRRRDHRERMPDLRARKNVRRIARALTQLPKYMALTTADLCKFLKQMNAAFEGSEAQIRKFCRVASAPSERRDAVDSHKRAEIAPQTSLAGNSAC